jgi:hypothetical protein
MIGELIDVYIKKIISETLNTNKDIDVPDDFIETDSFGEIIEKLSILHCRMWYLEDAISSASSDEEIANLKRKIDICFKIKRPKYVSAINKLIELSIKTNKKLSEDSVKLYKGFE